MKKNKTKKGRDITTEKKKIVPAAGVGQLPGDSAVGGAPSRFLNTEENNRVAPLVMSVEAGSTSFDIHPPLRPAAAKDAAASIRAPRSPRPAAGGRSYGVVVARRDCLVRSFPPIPPSYPSAAAVDMARLPAPRER